MDKNKEYNVATVAISQANGDTRRIPSAEYYGIKFDKFRARVEDTPKLRKHVEFYPDLSIVKTETVKYKESPRHQQGGE